MTLTVSTHAVARYVERVKPGLDADLARQELERLLAISGPTTPTPPSWLRAHDADTEAFVELADGIVAAIKCKAVATILIRGGSHSSVREARTERKRKAKAARNRRQRIYTAIGRKQVEPRQRWR